MTRYIFILLISISALYAKESVPTLRSADGKKTIQATPIGVEGKKVIFRKKDGSTFGSSIQNFSPQDQEKLKTWMNALQTDPHYKLIDRVQKSKHLRVLFIGNSYSFHVPKAFEKIAEKRKKKITVEQVTSGGCTLARHAKSEKLLEKIQNGKYDVVVLQEQSMRPSFPEAQRSKEMDAAANTLVTSIKKSGAIPVFFQTWGRKNGDQQNKAVFPDDTFDKMQARLVTGYENVAKACGGDIHIVPVGMLWKKGIDQDQNLADKLFSPDGSHPAKEGVRFTAAAFFSALYDEPLDDKVQNHTDDAQLLPIPFQ